MKNKYTLFFLFYFTHSLLNAQCWKSVAAGSSHVVAVKSDGTLWAWGFNYYGQLGMDDTLNRDSPTQVGTESSWKSVTCGGNHTLAIKNDGSLWAWGWNRDGQLGLGHNNVVWFPVRVGNSNNWERIWASFKTSYAAKSGGSLWAWGSNYSGQIGNGNDVDVNIPTLTQFNSSDFWLNAVSSRCTVFDNTTWELKGWGSNVFGQLGVGDTLPRYSPALISNEPWSSVSGNSFGTIGIKYTGANSYELFSCGDGIFGIGLPAGQKYLQFTPINVGGDWKQVGTSYTYMYAINQNGTLWLVTDSGVAPIGSATNWATLISTQGNSMLALKTDGSLWGWGSNSWGELGLGYHSNNFVHSPLKISSCNANGIPNIGDITTFSVFPNPSSGQLSILQPTTSVLEYILYDCVGRELNRYPASTTTVNLELLPNGIYYLYNQGINKKIVLNR